MAGHHNPEAPIRRDEHPGDGVARSTARMEIYADAVFAIAFTLPVVELVLPEAGDGRLDRQILDLWPSYLGYILSALVIGIYWVQHHFTGAIYRTAGHHFLVATLLFLMAIGFIAFPTRVFAEHVADPRGRETAAIFYTLSLGVTAVAWWAKWRTGLAYGDVDDRLDRAYVARLNRTYGTSALLMTLATGLVFVKWEIGLALAALVTLSYLRPPKTPEYNERAPAVEGEE